MKALFDIEEGIAASKGRFGKGSMVGWGYDSWSGSEFSVSSTISVCYNEVNYDITAEVIEDIEDDRLPELE